MVGANVCVRYLLQNGAGYSNNFALDLLSELVQPHVGDGDNGEAGHVGGDNGEAAGGSWPGKMVSYARASGQTRFNCSTIRLCSPFYSNCTKPVNIGREIEKADCEI